MSMSNSSSPTPGASTSQRTLKQLGLCFAGVGCVILSTIITRRAVARHHFAAKMKIFQQSNQSFTAEKKDKGKAALMAVEALQLSTLNLASWTVFAVGGFSWALDISSMDELKQAARRHTRSNPNQTDSEAEEAFQAELAQLMVKYMPQTQVEELLKKTLEEKAAASKKPKA